MRSRRFSFLVTYLFASAPSSFCYGQRSSYQSKIICVSDHGLDPRRYDDSSIEPFVNLTELCQATDPPGANFGAQCAPDGVAVEIPQNLVPPGLSDPKVAARCVRDCWCEQNIDNSKSPSIIKRSNVELKNRLRIYPRQSSDMDDDAEDLETGPSESSFSSTASSYNSEIVCIGDLPPGPYGDGTREWQRKDFKSLTDLCSINGNKKGNMLGKCIPFRPGGPTIDIPEVAHPPSLTDPDNQQLCVKSCICKIQWDEFRQENQWLKGGPENVPDMFIDSTLEKIRSMRISTNSRSQCGYSSPPDLEPLCTRPDVGSWNRMNVSPLRSRRGARRRRPTGIENLDSAASKELACASSCSRTNFRCSEGHANCVCALDRVSKGLWDIGGCTIPKKRDAVACPCNGTYVSQSCCWADDGTVWEPFEYFLGVLRV